MEFIFLLSYTYSLIQENVNYIFVLLFETFDSAKHYLKPPIWKVKLEGMFTFRAKASILLLNSLWDHEVLFLDHDLSKQVM